jgi:hypothetical protein
VKAPTRAIRHLALATTVLGMAHCPAAAAGQNRHRPSHLVIVTHHPAPRRFSLPPAAFPDPAGLALLLNPDALALADAEDGSTVLTVKPPVALADLDQLRAPPIAGPQPAPQPPLRVTLAERLAAAAAPPIIVPPGANIAVVAPPVVLALAAPLPAPPPPPAPVAALPPSPAPVAALPPSRPIPVAAVPPSPPPPPPRRVARRVYATPARAQALLQGPRTYYAPHYEPPPPPYGMLIGPPRGYGYGYWGGYGYY